MEVTAEASELLKNKNGHTGDCHVEITNTKPKLEEIGN